MGKRERVQKNAIDLKLTDGKAKRPEMMNEDLGRAEVYDKLDQKSVTAWLDLRNKAAHGRYSEYTSEPVGVFIQSVCDFIARCPA